MATIDWLERNAPGWQALSSQERDAITQFSLLWMMFESGVLETQASATAIIEASKQWATNGQLTADMFRQELVYFRERYVEKGSFTHRFDHLHLRKNDAPGLVKKVLKTDEVPPDEIAAAVLIIVYRFRNNLFHGVKWLYALKEQLDNFIHANSILMKAIELHQVDNNH